MTEHDALLQAVIASPDDDSPRLAFADWLDEHGEAERAELIRVQCTLHSLRPGTIEYARPAGRRLGDTLVGVGADGGRVSVCLPEGTVRRTEDRVAAVPEPELPAAGAEPVAAFEVTVDGNPSFGNPQFVVG